jgi:hypothetical protein
MRANPPVWQGCGGTSLAALLETSTTTDSMMSIYRVIGAACSSVIGKASTLLMKAVRWEFRDRAGAQAHHLPTSTKMDSPTYSCATTWTSDRSPGNSARFEAFPSLAARESIPPSQFLLSQPRREIVCGHHEHLRTAHERQ